jgi:hypothetical protein
MQTGVSLWLSLTKHVSYILPLKDKQKLIYNLDRSPPLPKTLAEGTATTVAAALDPSLDGHSGAYLKDCKPFKPADFAFDPENADILWRLSEELVGEKFTL